jgi:hypothetical protein
MLKATVGIEIPIGTCLGSGTHAAERQGRYAAEMGT